MSMSLFSLVCNSMRTSVINIYTFFLFLSIEFGISCEMEKCVYVPHTSNEIICVFALTS